MSFNCIKIISGRNSGTSKRRKSRSYSRDTRSDGETIKESNRREDIRVKAREDSRERRNYQKSRSQDRERRGERQSNSRRENREHHGRI